MKQTFRISLALAALAAGMGQAAASGGIGCEVDDKNLKLAIQTGVTRGMGSPVFNFGAEANIKSSEVAADLRQTKFEQEHLAQYWLGDGEMKMVLYRERDSDKPHGYVEMVVRTKVHGEPDEGTYQGEYDVAVFDGTGDGEPKQFAANGKLECFVE